MKNVQKFQPGIDCWLSDRLTSSSLEETAESNADKIPSFTFESNSAQAVGLSMATGQASCTHLQTICNLQPHARNRLGYCKTRLSRLSVLKSARILSSTLPFI